MDRRSLGMLGTILAATMISAMPMPLRADATVAKATISDFATSIQLPSANMYLYGMVTGGASQSSAFAAGQYAQAVDAAGYIAAALAYGTNNQNSYTTSTAYQVIGGVSVSGSWDGFKTFYNSNSTAGASSASANFTVSENSLVVFIGLASSQQNISLGGISGLQVDAVESGAGANLGMVIAHASLSPGTYTVTEQSAALAAGQDPNHMADLIGVFVFGSNSTTIPTVNTGGVVNAASSVPGAVAPGSIASVYGSFLLTSPSQAPGVPWPTSLSGLSMEFGGKVQVPLNYAASGQVDIQVPWELAGQSQATLTATVNGQTSAPAAVGLASFAPGLFSMNGQGTGQGAILDSSYRVVDASNPAIAGSTYIQIYCTGLGAVTNQPPTGSPAPSSALAATTTIPTVTMGGAPAYVLFSGLAPGTVGLYQVNAQVPAKAPAGSAVPVVVSIGGFTSNAVTIAVASVASLSTYTVSFTESGLSAVGSSWSVTLNGVTESAQIPAGTLGTIRFQVPNGVYSYTANGTPGTCPLTMTGTVTVSGGNLSKTISFTSPTFFLPITSGGKSYSLAVFGDADQFSALTNALNSTQPLYVQAVYLLNSVLNPTTYPVNAIEVEDPMGNLVTSSTQLMADAFIWAYSYVNQSQLAQPCTLLDQAYQGRSLQSLGINLVTGLEWADFASTIASDITTALGPDDAAAFASSVSLFQDILGGWSALSSDTKVNAPSVVSQLETLGLISKSSGNNYTAAELLTNLASLNPSELGSVVSSLYGSAYGKSISSKASSYAQTFWGQFVTGVEQSLVPSALAGGYAFYETYGVYELTAATSAGITASSFATAAAGGLVNAASAAVIQGYLVPLKDLLEAESSIESSANSICTGSTAVFTPVQSGSASIDSAGAYAATSGFVYALLASWFGYDAQLNKGEQSGAYTFSDVLSFLGSSLATEFQMSAQQEASNEGFDEASAPIAEGWTNAIGALFKASTSAANSLVNAAACGVPGTSIISLSSQNVIFQTPVAVGSSSAAQTVTLTNTGTVTLTITGMPLGGANPGDFLVSNNCGGSVPAGANCTISITFAPTGTGTRTAGINVTGNASNSPQNVALTGTGISGTGPQPTITSLSPASTHAGSSSLVLTINGTGFTPSSTVTFHGVSHAATFINSGQLTITLSASDLATAGSFPVVVTNPAPGGGTSAPVSFTVQAQVPIAITAVSKVIAQSDPPIIITGSGFGTFPYPLPASLPYYPTILYSWSPLTITNNSQNWRAGGPWDTCTLALNQWSDSSVSLVADVNEGFGFCPLAVGDQLTISIWNPESSGPSPCAPSGDTAIGQCATVTVTVAAH